MKAAVFNWILPTAHVFVFHNKISLTFIADESLIYHGYSNLSNYSKLKRSNLQWLRCHIINSSDVFANFFFHFCTRIFLGLSCWKRKQISYWSKTFFFSQFASWKRNLNKYLLKNRRFGIRNGWNYLMSPSIVLLMKSRGDAMTEHRFSFWLVFAMQL